MKQLVIYAALTAVIVALAILQTGCATKRVMKNCTQMKAEGYEQYAICEEQYRIWR